MIFTTIMGLVAYALQLAVAAYALRLNRLFGTARVGWSLFSAFTLLALIQLIQSATPFNVTPITGIPIEVMYSLISFLLFTAMVHLETLLEKQMRLESKEQELRDELDLEVKKQTAYLTRVIEELKAGMGERKGVEIGVGTANTELTLASRQVKAAEMAASVLQNIDKMLKSVKATASIVSNQTKQTNIANVVHVSGLIREHAADLGGFMARDPRGKRLPQYIAKLANRLAREQTALSQELESLKKNLEKIMAVKQSYTKFAWQGEPVEGASLVGS